MTIQRILVLLALLTAPQALGKTISISEGGIIFGEPNCKLLSHKVKVIHFEPDPFDYLSATVVVQYTCVTRDGRKVNRHGQDSVVFSALEFNLESQEWESSGLPVAKRTTKMALKFNPQIKPFVAATPDEVNIAFKVHLNLDPEILTR